MGEIGGGKVTHDQLSEYINRFKEHNRETIAKQIIDSDLLARAFDTTEGKQILNSAIDLIASDVIGIVKLCTETDDQFKQTCKIVDKAVEINTTYKLMKDWANILLIGREHKEQAEKIK
jgi:hypothetical protein